jgi:glycosyltransferase involved in cell wall biosynthesis
MVLRRGLLPSPCFDEVFSPGYGEESDLSMRLREGGLEVLGCPQVFLHHQGRASFESEAGPFMAHPHYKIFMDRWSDAYHKALIKYRKAALIAELRGRYPRTPERSLSSSLRLLRRIINERGVSYAVREAYRRLGSKLLASLRSRGLRWTLGEISHKVRAEPLKVVRADSKLKKPLSHGSPRILFLLEEVSAAGGVKVVVEWVNALIMRGVDACVAVPVGSPIFRQGLSTALFEPYFYRSRQDLAAYFNVDIVVATLWSTAIKCRYLLDQGRAKHGIFFIQDREEYFYREQGLKRKVRRSYSLLPNLWTTSSWIADYLGSLGHDSEILAPGISLDDFYPGERRHDLSRPCLLAMARPEKGRRGFATLVKLLSRLRDNGAIFEAVLFGSENASRSLPWAEVHGFVRGSKLRRLYQAADIFIDASRYQAFGLPNLEAMACQTAVIGPLEGGFRDFGAHEKNAYLVDTQNVDGLYHALGSLLTDPKRIQALQQQALKTARAMTVEGFVERSLLLFSAVLGHSINESSNPWIFR